MQPTSDDKLAASVFALGLTHGFIQREDVVRWADLRIEETDVPAAWYLSLSSHADFIALASELKRIGKGTDPVAVCEAMYSLVPDVVAWTFEQAKALARQIYRIMSDCPGDWSNPLLRAARGLADDFQSLRDGELASTESRSSAKDISSSRSIGTPPPPRGCCIRALDVRER